MSEKLKVIIADSNPTARNIIKSYLKDIEQVELCAEFDDVQEGLKYTGSLSKCILFIDISENENEILNNISRLRKENRNAIIVSLSNSNSTNTIIKAMRAGSSEFLQKPVTETAFHNLVNDILQNFESGYSENACKIISTFSNKGGIGKTSIAVNTAIEIAEMTKEKVALIDLNLQLGDVSTFLDLTPAFDIAYIVKNLDNMDDETIIQSLTQYKNSSLFVIADPVNIEKSKEITAEQIEKLLTRLKRIFSYIIIDVSTSIDAKSIKALDFSNLVLLIAIVNLPAIRNLQRCMNMFEKLGYSGEKIKLILNRYMENEDIKTADIEEVVKQKVYWKIPNNYLTMMSAVNKGVPVNSINPDSNIAVNYKDFASKLCDYLVTQKLQKNYTRETIKI